MHEKMELKTHKLAVLLTAAWPMMLALLLLTAATKLTLPWSLTLQVAGVMLGIILLTLACCMPLYVGVYVFLPPTEYKGARLIARLGRNETEIAGVSRAEIIVKQNFIEKALGVCHIRQKGTAVYLRGVPEPERVTAWLDANFPEKTTITRNLEMKAQKGKKHKK